MKQKGTKDITFTQRLQLEAYLSVGLHKKQIAQKLGLCLATVYNEIKRGQYKRLDGATWLYNTKYSPDIAEQKARFNQTSKGCPLKVGKDYNFCNYVEKRIINDKISPCAVVGEIKRHKLFNTIISKTTIYRYIDIGIFLNIKRQHLQFGIRKKRYKKTISKAPKGISIEKRLETINNRSEFGHWEMDCVCGSTKYTYLTMAERQTREILILPMTDQKADSVLNCLQNLSLQYGTKFTKVFKSITVDNGTEFSNEKILDFADCQKIPLYFCHPYSAYERGTNERLNREIRRHIPKGSDLSKYSDEDISKVEQWINNYPREIFNYATSSELFNQAIANI